MFQNLMTQYYDNGLIVALMLPIRLRLKRSHTRVLNLEVEAKLLEQLRNEVWSIFGRQV